MPIKKLFKHSKKILHKTKNKYKEFKTAIDDLKKKKSKKEASIVCDVPSQERSIVDISTLSVTKATLAIIGLLLLTYFFYEIRETLLLLFISLFLATVFDPIVDKMEGKKIPRWLGIIIIYLAITLIVVFFVVQIIPLVIDQIKAIAISVTGYLKDLYFDFISESYRIPLIPMSWNEWLREFLQNLQLNQLIDYFGENCQWIIGSI